MYNLDDVLKHQEDIKNNILKSFKMDEEEIEKSKHGIYADNSENRRLNRVGKEYGEAAKQQDSNQKQSTGKESDNKGLKEHAKNTSDETLKKVIANKNAPEDLKQEAKKELENRSKQDVKNQTIDRFNQHGELDEEHPDNKKMWDLEKKVDSSNATEEELKEFISLRNSLKNYNSLQHFEDETQRRIDDLKDYEENGDSDKFVKKYIHLFNGFGTDGGTDEEGKKLKIGQIRTNRKYSNDKDILDIRAVSPSTKSGFRWLNSYQAAEQIKSQLEGDIKTRLNTIKQVKKLISK